MYRQILSSTIIALIHLITPTRTHVLPSSSHLPLPAQSCPSPESPRSFSLSQITYLRYEVSRYTPTAPPNSTQLAFEISNPTTGISTGCALQTIMNGSGEWINDSETWYTCLERSITIGGKEYPVRTSARVDWDAWLLAVNQTWVCEEGVTIDQSSALTLAPTCTENKTGLQYIKECTAPDVVVIATSDNSMVW